jgi:hypothetical protein
MSSILEILSEQELNFRKENLMKQIKKIDNELSKRNLKALNNDDKLQKIRIKVKVNIK